MHDRRVCKIRDLPIYGRGVMLMWLRRRFVCDACGKRYLEAFPEAFGDKMTIRLEHQVI